MHMFLPFVVVWLRRHAPVNRRRNLSEFRRRSGDGARLFLTFGVSTERANLFQ